MQVNFSGFIVIPLFRALAKLFPEIQKVLLPALLENRQRWSELLKAEELAKTMFPQSRLSEDGNKAESEESPESSPSLGTNVDHSKNTTNGST